MAPGICSCGGWYWGNGICSNGKDGVDGVHKGPGWYRRRSRAVAGVQAGGLPTEEAPCSAGSLRGRAGAGEGDEGAGPTLRYEVRAEHLSIKQRTHALYSLGCTVLRGFLLAAG